MRALSFILLICFSFICSDEVARIRIGKKFVDDLVQTFLPQAVQQINKLKPFETDIGGTYLWLFPLHFNIRNFTFEDVAYNRSQYSVSYNSKYSAIDIEVANFRLNAFSTIYHKFLFFSNSTGQLHADLNVNLKISLSITRDRNGFFSLGLNDYNFNYKGSDISFKGGFFEWNVQLWVNTFEFFTEFILRQVLKGGINSALSSINSNIQQQITIPKTGSSIQVKPDDIVRIDDSHIDLAARFFFKFNNTKKNLRMLSDSEIDDTEDFKVLINHDLMNAFSKAFFIDNIFALQLTSANIPENIPFKINTRFFQHIIPGIYDKYPDKEMIITIKATTQPKFNFNKNNQSIEFSTDGDINFSLTDTPSNNILSIGSQINLDVRLGANYTDSSVHLLIKKLEISKMTIKSSEFKDLDIDDLRDNLNTTFEIVCNAANKYYLIKGIPLPLINGLKFKKVVVQVEETYFSLTIQPDVQATNFSWLRLN